MLRYGVTVLVALLAASAVAASGPFPPKHESQADHRFKVYAANSNGVDDYGQLGDDPQPGTPISFQQPQRITCFGAGAQLFDLSEAVAVTVDLTRGDVPLINFTENATPRSILLSAPSMGCEITGRAAGKQLTTVIEGGTGTHTSGFTNFDGASTITCFENGQYRSRSYAVALTVGAAQGFVGLDYMDENGQPITQQFDGAKRACVVEPAGMELTKAPAKR